MAIDSKAKAFAHIKRFIDTEKRIPQLPQILMRIEGALDDPTVGGKELARVILDDPSLTAQVLKVANSTYYNPRGSRIKTVSRAIVILGFDNIRRLVLGLSVSRLFTLLPAWNVYRNLWRHSLATAILSRDLAREDGFADVEVAFVAGLLHDVGKFILGHLHGEAYAGLLETYRQQPETDLCRLESEAFYCNHQEVGTLLAQSWGLPRELIRVISRHRPGPRWRYFIENRSGLGSYVILANRMAHLLELKSRVAVSEYQERLRELQPQAEIAFGLDREGFNDLLESLADKIREAAAYFDIELDDPETPSPDRSPAVGRTIVKRFIDESAFSDLTLKISESSVSCSGFSDFVEVTAGPLFSILGLELLIIYLPGSKGQGLAPAVCFGGGRLAELLGRTALAGAGKDLISQVFSAGRILETGEPPVELDADLRTICWTAGRILGVPLADGGSVRGVLLLLRNIKTAPFQVREKRLLKLYGDLLGRKLAGL
ncbi:MAG: HDOD domain-containing protein [Deltaproteobacteria bacterium]|nr:HDOD domain-containing protein [Deltaproteobacteria bacterium]